MSQVFTVIDNTTGAAVGPDDIPPDCLAWQPIGRVNGWVIDQEGSIGIETRSGEIAYLSTAGAERYTVLFTNGKGD